MPGEVRGINCTMVSMNADFFSIYSPTLFAAPSVERHPFNAGVTPSLEAMVTKSASEPAAIFRITLPRCAFTVISLIPSLPPTCLFNRPETTKAMTSLSRRLSDACQFRSARVCASCSRVVRLRSMACRMALTIASSLNGFVRNSTAPAFIAWTVVGTSR